MASTLVKKATRVLTLLSVFALLLSGCSEEMIGTDTTATPKEETMNSETEQQTEYDFTEYPESIEGYVLRSGKLTVNITKDGRLESVASDAVSYLSNQSGLSFSVVADTKQGNIWDTDPDAKGNKVFDDTDALVKVVEATDSRVSLYHEVEGVFGLLRHYTLRGETLTVDAVIYNEMADGTVISVTPMCVDGLQCEKKPLDCAWPYKEGRIYRNGNITDGKIINGATTVSAHYPTPMSMQYAVLFDEERSIYFGVHDDKAEYKTFTYAVNSDNTSAVSCEVMPFAAPGEKKELAPVVLSFGQGDWTYGADIYRTFLAEAGWTKNSSVYAQNLTGITGWTTATYFNKYETKYVSYAPAQTSSTFEEAMKQIINRTSFSSIWITGWHDGGFDTLYPDYEISSDLGGLKGFKAGIKNIHEQGGNAVFYVNAHISDIESKFFAKHGQASAIKKADGSVYEEEYPTTEADFVAMCPASEVFRERLLETVSMLRKNGVDGIYFDQISEIDSYLCFDASHGHTTPATAYYEGYSKLLDGATEIFNASEGDWLFAIEGVCDCYGKWIDVFYGYPDFNLSEMTRYTLTSKMIGRDRVCGVDESGDALFTTAFVMSKPLLCHKHHILDARLYNNPNIKRFISLYEKYPDIYLRGRYVYTKGLNGVSATMTSGVTISEENNRVAVSLFNGKSLGETTVEFTYTPSTGRVVAAYHAETGENLLTDQGTVRLTLDKNELISVILDIG